MVLFLWCTLTGQPQPPAQVFLENSSHPIPSGEVWLVAHKWGFYPASLVATIRNGRLDPLRGPAQVASAVGVIDFRLFVAISDHSLPARELRDVENAYFGDLTDGSHADSYFYLSDAFKKAEPRSSWMAALSQMGRAAQGGVLILPRPGTRVVRMLYPDGRPFAGARIEVSLFGSAENHCGMPAGVSIGTYETDSNGRISFTAALGPLALDQHYYREESAGAAGVRFVLEAWVLTGPGQNITEQRLWNLPQRPYALTLRTGPGTPLVGAKLSGCLWNEVCGAVCGSIPLGGKASDSAGLLQFEERDLRSMETISVVNADGEERELNESELRQLMTTGRLAFEWR